MSTHPTVTPTKTNTETADQLENQPMTLYSKNRLYTSKEQRRRLGIDTDQHGRGVGVRVMITHVDRDTDWEGGYIQSGLFETELRTYGAIGVPQSLVERFDLSKGDNVRVQVEPLVKPVSVSATVE